jgi:hypothetical protein
VGRFVNHVLLTSWLLLVAFRDYNEKNINLLWMSTYVLYLFEARKKAEMHVALLGPILLPAE